MATLPGYTLDKIAVINMSVVVTVQVTLDDILIYLSFIGTAILYEPEVDNVCSHNVSVLIHADIAENVS